MVLVFVGDYIEVEGEIVNVGNSLRKMVFEVRKVIVLRLDIFDLVVDVLVELIVVCRVIGICVILKDK